MRYLMLFMSLLVIFNIKLAIANNKKLIAKSETERDLVWVNREFGIRVLDSNKILIGKRGAQYGPIVDISSLPKHLIDALVAKEDKRFFEHAGVDFWQVAGILKDLTIHHRLRGGSTLTMQVSRMVKLDDEEKSNVLKRKILELVNAIQIEKNLPKQAILFLYLNRVYFGKRLYGISAASQYYFKKLPANLSLMESAMLVGMLTKPNKLDPEDYPVRCRQKAIVVLDLMMEQGKISKKKYDLALKERVIISKSREDNSQIQFFVNHVENVLNMLPNKSMLKYGTITVITTLDLKIQRIAEGVLLPLLSSNPSSGKPDQGALLGMRRETGAIVTMIGGRDFKKSQFNNAIAAQRQAGSIMKLFVYIDALERGLEPDTTIHIGNIDKIYMKHIHNFNDQYPTTIQLEEAFIHSVNTAAVRLTVNRVPNIIALARRFHVNIQLNEVNNLGIALGTESVSLIDMVGAYNVIANDGRYVQPYSIQEIRDAKSSVIYKKKRDNGTIVLNKKIAEYMNDLLVGVVNRGTGQKASYEGYAAGKTGTSQDNRDAWFIGFNRELCIGVWVGNQNNKPMMNISGSTLPAIVWRNFIIKHVKHSQRKSLVAKK